MLIYEQCINCPVAQAKKEELLQNSESVYDAIYDHQKFIQDCMKTCSKFFIPNPTECKIK